VSQEFVPNQKFSVQRIIALTGGISTGKTTVADYLARVHHFPILDADVYAREAVLPGSAILDKLCDRYGPSLRLPDGSLNRAQLGAIIFQDPEERQWVESLVHPYVRACFERERLKLQSAPTLVMVIPLLFEANLTHLATEIWVVACTEAQQLERLIQRNGLTQAEALARINSQWPLSEKCKRADVILDNSGDRETLYAQIDQHLEGA
jgi:dephospho-CoA kinase